MKLNGRLKHAAWGIGDIPANEYGIGMASIMEAYMVTTTRPFSHVIRDGGDFLVYRFVPEVHTLVITQAVARGFDRFATKVYPVLSLLWFIYRFYAERLGFDVRRQGNWFSSNEICSEQPWWVMMDVCEHLLHLPMIRTLTDIFHEWRSSTFHPVDLWEVCERSSAIRFVGGRWNGEWV